MRVVLSTDADLAVRRLTAGQFHLAAEDDGVYLVDAAGGGRVLIARSTGEPAQPGNGSRANGRNGNSPDGDIRARALREIEATLSERERQVFEMLGAGSSMNEIAERLEVSVKTIETYRTRIKRKLGIQNRTRLVALAVEWVLSRRNTGDGWEATCPV